MDPFTIIAIATMVASTAVSLDNAAKQRRAAKDAQVQSNIDAANNQNKIIQQAVDKRRRLLATSDTSFAGGTLLTANQAAQQSSLTGGTLLTPSGVVKNSSATKQTLLG